MRRAAITLAGLALGGALLVGGALALESSAINCDSMRATLTEWREATPPPEGSTPTERIRAIRDEAQRNKDYAALRDRLVERCS